MEPGIHELSAPYALDALDDAERVTFEEHLETCVRCREDVRSFLDVAAALAVAASGPAPRDVLRDRLLESVASDRGTVVSLAEHRRRRLVPTTPMLGAVAAVAACAALAFGLWSASLDGELDRLRATVAADRETTAILAAPTARTVSLQAGNGKLVVTDTGDAVIVLDELPPAPAGRDYALWIVEGDTPRPAGIFEGSDDLDVVRIDGSVAPGSLVAVTIEPDGGAERPTTTPFAASAPV